MSNSNKCYKCGKELTTGDTDNLCSECRASKPSPLLTGWVCPVCGGGLSPYTTRCPCQPLYGQITYT